MNYVEGLRQIVGHRPLILVGAVTIIIKDSNILLQKRKSTSYGMWGLPGGLMELGESTEETARREIYEETGLTAGKLHLIDVFSGADNFLKISNGDECYFVTVAYYTQDITGTIKIDEKESLAFQYFPIDRLPDNTVKSHGRMIERFIEMYRK